jgi:UDP-N-acetylmuramoyl-L-alanyl-D-glutamate--2,6-diaminopimelate ligase
MNEIQQEVRLGELLKDLANINPAEDITITGITLDSRKVKAGDIFFAYPGTRHDGRDYIQQAVDQGATAVIYESDGITAPQVGVSCYPVPHLQHEIGVIADRFYGKPSSDLFITGVTGTNGKTTCTHLLTQAFEALGRHCGLIGTLGIGVLDDITPGLQTTPDPIRLHRELRRFRDNGVSHVCIEVSSHALDQGRVAGVGFDVAVFTNLSHDHLDYHDDMAAYGSSKALLFDCASLHIAVLNHDDPFSYTLRARTSAEKTWTFGMEAGDVYAESVAPDNDGLTVVMKTGDQAFTVRSSLIGRINAANLLAVAAVLLACGHDTPHVVTAMELLRPVPGRMELFRAVNDVPTVVVDYAHTPDALSHALRSIRQHCAQQLWCVFGCGGDRDRAKRPMMGQMAETLADVVILTDDNPRLERPKAIVSEIISGMEVAPKVIHDRSQAIRWAIHNADPQDWVLVAGKGHEMLQQIGDRKIPLSDRDIVSQTLGMTA